MADNSLLVSIERTNIKEYNGNEKHQPLHVFLESIERIRLGRPSITDEELLGLAISKCSGHAYGVIRSATTTITSIEELEKILQLGCGVYDNPEVYEIKLITCKQEQNESVNDFHRRICSIQNKLERCRETELGESEAEKKTRMEEEKAKVLKRGLLPRYKDEIRRKEIKGANQILKFALQEEMFLSPTEKANEELVNAIWPMLQTKLTMHGQQQQVDAVNSGLSVAAVSFQPGANHHPGALVGHWQQQQQQRQTSHKQDSYKKNMNQYLPTNNTIRCYNCNQTGHFSSNCATPSLCWYCGVSEHNMHECPSIPCTRCNSFGHTPRTCNAK